MTNAVTRISTPYHPSASGNPHDSRSIRTRDSGAVYFHFGNIAYKRCVITPVCSVMCMTYRSTNTRIYSASARWLCNGCERAVSVKNGYSECAASRPAAQMHRKITRHAKTAFPARYPHTARRCPCFVRSSRTNAAVSSPHMAK